MKESSDSQAVITHLYDGLEQSIVDIVTSCAKIGYSVRSNGGMLKIYNEDEQIHVSLNQKVIVDKINMDIHVK